ncbi:MAG: hypothetical protein RR348_03745, partial [Clostridia bacterium]
HLPTAKILSEFMSSNSKYGFSSCYVASAKRNFNYSVVATLISFFYYILTIAAAVALAVAVSKWNILFGFMTFFLSMGVVVSIKRALLVAWLPAYVVDEQSMKNSFKTCFKYAKEKFWYNFIVFYTYYLVFIAITITLSFVTFLTAVPFFLGFVFVYEQAFELVTYYHYRGYKYYKDEQTVVDPKKRYGNAVLENPVVNPNHGDLNVSGEERAEQYAKNNALGSQPLKDEYESDLSKQGQIVENNKEVIGVVEIASEPFQDDKIVENDDIKK